MSGAAVLAQWWCSEMGESSRDGALWRLGVSLRRRESGHCSRDGGLRVSGAVVPAQWWCSEMGECSRDGALWRFGG